MLKVSFLAITAILLSILTVNYAGAIPTHDRQAVIDELDAYGIRVQDHYPNREPSTADDYYKLGIAYLFRNMPRAASEQFLNALKLDARHVDALISLAASAAQLGETQAAMEYSRKALEVEPGSAKAHNALGALNLAKATSLENLANAESSFRKAITLDPGLLTARMNLARLYVFTGRPAAATQEYESVIEAQPENVSAHAELARAYLLADHLDKATRAAERTAELAPRSHISHNILGEMYARRKEMDRALKEFGVSVSLEPTYAIAYKNMGSVYLMQGLLDKAIAGYQEALSYRPNYGEAYSGLGDAYMLKGMTEEAATEYRKALEILPVSALVSVPAYNNLAYIYAEVESNLDEALSLSQKAKQLAPGHPDVADTIGWIYYKMERYDEAATNLEDAIKGAPENPIIRYHLGAAYYRLGAKDEALAELRKAFDINDSFVGSAEARRLLDKLEAQ